MDSVKQKTLTQKSASADGKDINSKEVVCPVTDQNDDHSIKTCFTLIGQHENQIYEGEEADLKEVYKRCAKNQGHLDFIPIDLFTINHLPEAHRDIDLYELIRSVADLTVRIGVTMTSPERPDFWPNTKTPYHLSSLRGKETPRSGSGWVRRVEQYSSKNRHIKYKTCPCNKCKTSDKPRDVWWAIFVQTAAHVVFDHIETSHTSVRLFFDSNDSPRVTLDDIIGVEYAEVGEDRCMFTCVTCDKTLGRKLKKMEEHFLDVCEDVEDKHSKTRDDHKLSFIVSHPHGCSKQVTIGQWKELLESEEYEQCTKFTYTTNTCPGSSGASVHCVGYNGGYYADHLHGGSLSPGLNHSSIGSVYVLDDS